MVIVRVWVWVVVYDDDDGVVQVVLFLFLIFVLVVPMLPRHSASSSGHLHMTWEPQAEKGNPPGDSGGLET